MTAVMVLEVVGRVCESWGWDSHIGGAGEILDESWKVNDAVGKFGKTAVGSMSL